ncbi:clan AA aspartic protease (TIGR02281 family) [Roseiarcus fermentans]|uniref:Clan AA aspartic protease (TIGR02281 family) n=1 Tax=Roseiarcus fermentans TaxID=1473586 RepID=A0A366FKW7_9HYPH|nr:clan AA aspartic protease (TIGR02281 family) [Roseiarcus fermentans]
MTAGFDPGRAPARPAPTTTPIYLDRDGRTARVDVQLGSITKRMVIDTGATGLSIPAWIAERLLWRREAVEAQSAVMTLANGREELRQGVKLWSVTVGGRTLLDVYATVAPHEAEPLLGFPVLNQAGRFTIDTVAGLLIMG